MYDPSASGQVTSPADHRESLRLLKGGRRRGNREDL